MGRPSDAVEPRGKPRSRRLPVGAGAPPSDPSPTGAAPAGSTAARRGARGVGTPWPRTTSSPSTYSSVSRGGPKSASGSGDAERLAKHLVHVLDEHDARGLEHAARDLAQILPVLLAG